MPPDLLVWLVNEWGAVPRAAAGEDRAPPDAGSPPACSAGCPCVPAELLAAQALRHTADRLHRIFAATDITERVRLLATTLLTETASPARA